MDARAIALRPDSNYIRHFCNKFGSIVFLFGQPQRGPAWPFVATSACVSWHKVIHCFTVYGNF